MRDKFLLVLTATTMVLGSASCGLSPERSAREIISPPAPDQGRPSPLSTTATGDTREKLFFLQEGMLVPTMRQVATEPTIDVLIRELIAGPTHAEQAAGMTSALLGTTVIKNVRLTGSQATVELATGFEGTGRTDEVLAFAQIVCTLTARPEITEVSFTHRQQPISIPRADGSLSPGPLTTTDYADLITKE